MVYEYTTNVSTTTTTTTTTTALAAPLRYLHSL